MVSDKQTLVNIRSQPQAAIVRHQTQTESGPLPPFQGALQGLQIHLVLLICGDGFLPFTVLVEPEVKLRLTRIHLLMADAAGMGQQGETVGHNDLVHVLLPEGHPRLLLARGDLTR